MGPFFSVHLVELLIASFRVSGLFSVSLVGVSFP